MQSICNDHLNQKKVRGPSSRELIYVDASKKEDLDIFTYMTKQYFNVSTEAVRRRYNSSYLEDLQEYHKDKFSSISIEEIGASSVLFDKQKEIYKESPYWQKE